MSETERPQDRRPPPIRAADETVELFEQAVAAHSRRLLAIARAIVGTRAAPEDIVQQAVMNLFQHRERYDWREPGGLLKRAVVNESLRILRHPPMAMVGEEHPDEPATPLGGMIENETVQQVRSAIARLPEQRRTAFYLCDVQGYETGEVARLMGLSPGTVRSHVHHARTALRVALAELRDEAKNRGG